MSWFPKEEELSVKKCVGTLDTFLIYLLLETENEVVEKVRW
jgi:hypothetical protein